MNANELADELETGLNEGARVDPKRIQAAAMLRQLQAEIEALKAHPVKEQSNLVNVVKDHIEDLWRCVKTFRSYEMDNTADEMEVAIKELEDAIEAHPVKELTDEEWIATYKTWLLTSNDPLVLKQAILRKAQ